MKIKDSEHVFIAGQNGSGKTYLGKHLASRYEGLKIILDTKGTFNWENLIDKKRVKLITSLDKFIRTCESLDFTELKFDSIVYRPDFTEMEIDSYNTFFQQCYFLHKKPKFSHVLVFVDEVMAVCPNPSKIPLYYKGILTRGRELKVSVWSLSQRPATIPTLIFSESLHWFIFNLVFPDRERLKKFTGYEEFMDDIPQYSFWYWNSAKPKKPILAKI